MTVLNWSERDEARGRGWHDCTYSSYLMALVFGGRRSFPKGIYTPAEREELESSDDRRDETGANLENGDQAVAKRYGARFVLKAPTEPLDVALTRVGTGLILQGLNGRLPNGSHWRRWDPDFEGGHCVFGIPRGGGKVVILDPEAPWKFPGDVVDVATVLRWAYGPKYARVVAAGVFAPKPRRTYKVQPGDTLSSIAAKRRVVGGWRAIYRLNRDKIGDDPNVIHAGLVLRLPPVRS